MLQLKMVAEKKDHLGFPILISTIEDVHEEKNRRISSESIQGMRQDKKGKEDEKNNHHQIL